MTNGADANELYRLALEEPPKTRVRAEALKVAARAADAEGDAKLAHRARVDLVGTALDAGAVDDALVAFAACLAQCDRDPTEFPESSLLWKYKWVLEWTPRFSQIPREKLAGLLDDCARRYLRNALGEHALAKLRAMTSMYLGDIGASQEAYEKWKALKRDWLSDCRLCDLDAEVALLQAFGRESDALIAAERIFRGPEKCAEVPHITYARALLPALRAGRWADAVQWQRRGYLLLKTLPEKNVGHGGEHLACTAVLGDLGRGLRILRELLPMSVEHPSAYSQMTFLAGASVLADRLARAKEPANVAVPSTLGGDGRVHPHDAAELAVRFREKARAHAKAFDARNGNTATTELVAWWESFRDLEAPVPPPSAEDS